MKHFFMLTAFLFIQNTFAQQVNNISLSELPVRYVEVAYVPKTLTSNSYVFLDYGQIGDSSIWKIKERKDLSVLKDDEGKIMSFNSTIAMLNFLAKNEFRFVESYQELDSNGIDEPITVKNRKFLLENMNYKAKNYSSE